MAMHPIAGLPLKPREASAALALVTLATHADEDGAPHGSHELTATHGYTTLEILAGVGHWTPLEATGPMTEHLLEFL